jgi:hypothetical protein
VAVPAQLLKKHIQESLVLAGCRHEAEAMPAIHTLLPNQ